MKTSLDHLPHRKQRELARIVEVLHEEFEDALKEGTADFKKRGRILKIILFGSYARGTWVDESHTKKGYKSDYDLLIVVNSRKLTDFSTYWHKAQDRLMHLPEIRTPVSLIVHSRREVNTALYDGQYFFVEIRRDGIVLYELDDEPLAEPRPRTPADALRIATGYFEDRLPHAKTFVEGTQFFVSRRRYKEAAFLLHQSIEQAYAALLLVLTSYSPASHNLRHLRGLGEERDYRIAEVWPRDQHQHFAWFNILNEAYVKARYSEHYEISEEALAWLVERAHRLIAEVEAICVEHLERLRKQAKEEPD
ncbi:nucleotidyltransferase and HEPN domain-containing protein [Sinorhizobium alkalisoli]|uniref:Nucleotidyltransferase n=1 Tax=Sinorhizobium alkalisoli TaxID=1752398 RepID=A0A1E3V4G2_9HYPH|nr:nucleotidyltransferase and HEPN domain-containing protein [Sinorhizobium alkalisoli]ODR88410.1 nucleotidyltransferase [Sinorhizobium alkalisoli]